MIPLFIKFTEIEWLLNNNSSFRFSVARLDEIDPFVSGNKFYKLKYNIQKVIDEGKQGIITMGGAYSNHLAATAFACNKAGLKSIAVVRGEIMKPLNATLTFCEQQQMRLFPVERKDYNRDSIAVEKIREQHADYLFVPEGGNNADGLKGCTEILQSIKSVDSYTHIICCIGTGTTFKGIAASAKPHQTIIGIPVLKIKASEQDQFRQQHTSIASAATPIVLFDASANKYGTYNTEQIHFMNLFYTKTSIPTDIVYTSKLMQTVIRLAEQDYFPINSKLLVVHTGGLQGNNSLPEGTLLF